MSKHWEIIISGSGGQGVITAGIILAAAALKDGKNVIQTQSYGPEARGGASRCEVLISEENLAYPKVQQCNMLVALTQEALNKYSSLIAPGGMLITDKSIDTSALSNDIIVLKAPVYSTVANIGNLMVANILVLGVLNSVIDAVTGDSLAAAVSSRVPPSTIELNMKALTEGNRVGKELKREVEIA